MNFLALPGLLVLAWASVYHITDFGKLLFCEKFAFAAQS